LHKLQSKEQIGIS